MKTFPISAKAQNALDKAFQTHPLSSDQQQRAEAVQSKLESATRNLCGLTPDSEEQLRMIRCLQEAGFWAREAISKYGGSD